MDELFATAPTEQLNPAWDSAVEDGTLHLLFHVVSHDVATGRLLMDAGPGADTGAPGDPTYAFAAPPARLEMQLADDTFLIENTFDLDLYAEMASKPIHIHGLTGHGAFTADGTRILAVHLNGYLAEAQVTDLCLLIPGLGSVNFHWFMNLVEVCPTADSDSDNTPDSYHFVGVLRAGEVTDHFVSGQATVEDSGQTCDAHTQPCTARR